MAYQCPKCSSTNLHVDVVTSAKVKQNEDDTVETTVDNITATPETGVHAWDSCTNMWCADCNHCSEALTFEV